MWVSMDVCGYNMRGKAAGCMSRSLISMCVRERVCERERVCVCGCVSMDVCVYDMRERGESERDCVCVVKCGCVCICVGVCVYVWVCVYMCGCVCIWYAREGCPSVEDMRERAA